MDSPPPAPPAGAAGAAGADGADEDALEATEDEAADDQVPMLRLADVVVPQRPGLVLPPEGWTEAHGVKVYYLFLPRAARAHDGSSEPGGAAAGGRLLAQNESVAAFAADFCDAVSVPGAFPRLQCDAFVRAELGNPASFLVRFEGFVEARRLLQDERELASQVEALEADLG